MLVGLGMVVSEVLVVVELQVCVIGDVVQVQWIDVVVVCLFVGDGSFVFYVFVIVVEQVSVGCDIVFGQCIEQVNVMVEGKVEIFVLQVFCSEVQQFEGVVSVISIVIIQVKVFIVVNFNMIVNFMWWSGFVLWIILVSGGVYLDVSFGLFVVIYVIISNDMFYQFILGFIIFGRYMLFGEIFCNGQ